jgi:hypothetical protein
MRSTKQCYVVSAPEPTSTSKWPRGGISVVWSADLFASVTLSASRAAVTTVVRGSTVRIDRPQWGMAPPALTDQEVDRFIEDGFVHLEHVVPERLISAGTEVIWRDLGRTPNGPSSWTAPVMRLLPSDDHPFKAAFDNPRLFSAFDQLAGVGGWLPRPNLGLFVVRFPHADDPEDTGWHIDSSYPPEEAPLKDFDFSQWRVNVGSRGRALLMLFLYSDVGDEDAPTRIRVGSHLDVPPLLVGEGEDGLLGERASILAADATACRPTAFATGHAGDVYLCHPFVVHASQGIRGTTPRLLAQPPLGNRVPFDPNRSDGSLSPVEVAIRRGMAIRG